MLVDGVGVGDADVHFIFMQKIDGLTKLKKEIASMHVTVPLAMFCLDASKLNEELCSRTQRLKDRLIEFTVEENREVNQRYALIRRP